jgi:hypothetical protein
MKTFKAGLLSVVLAMALLFSLTPAQAFPIIDFETGGAGNGGTLALISGGNVIGSNIPINLVTISGALANNGVYNVDGAYAIPVANGGGTAGILSFNTATNTLTLVGSIPGLVNSSENLVLGSFAGHSAGGGGGFLVFSGFGPDTKYEGLLAAVGLPLDMPFNYFDFNISTQLAAGGAFTVTSTDLSNSGKVPEPISLILLGSGLVGAGLYRRLRRKS